MGSFPVETVMKRFCFSVRLSQQPTCPCWHLSVFKNSFPPAVFKVPVLNNAASLSAVIYDMDWASRVFTCTPLSVSCGTNIRRKLSWGQVVPSLHPSVCSFWFLNPFSVVVVFWVLHVTVSSVSVSGEKFPLRVWAGYAAFFRCSFSLWMLLFRERSIFHLDI